MHELQYGAPADSRHGPVHGLQYGGPAVARQGGQPQIHADCDCETYRRRCLYSVKKKLAKWADEVKRRAAEKDAVIAQQNAEIAQLKAEVREVRELRAEKQILAQIKQLIIPPPNAAGNVNLAAPDGLAQNMPFPNNATYPPFANEIVYGTLPPDNTYPVVQPAPQLAEGDPLDDVESLTDVEDMMQKFLQSGEQLSED